jgi:hypothetical protein
MPDDVHKRHTIGAASTSSVAKASLASAGNKQRHTVQNLHGAITSGAFSGESGKMSAKANAGRGTLQGPDSPERDQMASIGEESPVRMADEEASMLKVKLKVKSRRNLNEPLADIFAAFGEEYKKNGAKDDFSRSLNVRRHWKSDVDIRRWHKDLNDNSRFDKLLLDVKINTNPDFGVEQGELLRKHNALFRHRDSIEKERNPHDIKDAAVELRKIAMQITPKQKAKKKKQQQIAFLNDGFADHFHSCISKTRSNLSEPPPVQTQEAEVVAEPEVDPDDDEFHRQASSEYGAAYRSEDSRSRECQLDTGFDSPTSGDKLPAPSKDFASTSEGFFRSKPSSVVPLRPQTVSKEQLPKVPGSSLTLTLLLYKNGDPHHAGEAVFLRRRPKSMKELLIGCSESCKVMVRPAEALFDIKMQQVKAVEDVETGGVYLLKGKEVLNPPNGFIMCSRNRPEGTSMKQLAAFQQANATNAQQLPRSAMSGASSLLEGDVRLPVMGGHMPAGGKSGNSSVRRAGASDTWGISETLSWQLSYGGQVGLWSGRHHDYSMWPRMFSSRSSSYCDMRSTR